MKNEIVLYQSNELPERIEVRIEEETVWLNRQQLAVLFGRDVKTIGKHINNVFSEGELVKDVVVAKFATTTLHGATKGKTRYPSLQTRDIRQAQGPVDYLFFHFYHRYLLDILHIRIIILVKSITPNHQQ